MTQKILQAREDLLWINEFQRASLVIFSDRGFLKNQWIDYSGIPQFTPEPDLHHAFDVSYNDLPRPTWEVALVKYRNIRISAPYWFYLSIFAAIAALPWIKWRFSLRTLLIVLTLFALFFGAIAMSM